MTLSTNVYVLDPVDVRELFHFAQGLLTRYDEGKRTPEQQRWSDEERHAVWGEPGTRSIANKIGQNLPGILDISYRPDGPLRTPEQAAAHDDDCDEDCSGNHYRRACFADLDLDTAYSARFEGGMGCGDLHATLVAAIGKWLDERGIRWEWRNEFTGEVHGGDDRYERLIDLCSGGFEATAWFRTTALPAVLAHIASEGGKQ